VGEGEELVFRAGSFGTVFLLTTWEFLADPARALAECRRVLKPGGRLVNAYLDRDVSGFKLRREGPCRASAVQLRALRYL